VGNPWLFDRSFNLFHEKSIKSSDPLGSHFCHLLKLAHLEFIENLLITRMYNN
jgi:hypothetical protein